MICRRFLAVALGAALMFPAASEAAPDRIVHHQGRLVDSNGLPLEGTLGRLTFRLYSTAAPSSATFVWGEVHEGVRVARGVYTVGLGAGTRTLDADGNETPGARPFTGEFDGGPRYLEVQVDADPPLGPLTRVGSVPHAITADGAVPIGTVVDWYRPTPGTAVPAGWQICDGAAVADPDSPMAGQPTPNLIGRFVRGIDPAQVTATSYGAGTPTALPDVGGTDSLSLGHAHGVASHSHSLPTHQHTITADGGHTHAGTTGPGVDRVNAVGGVRFVYAGIDGQHDHTFTTSSAGAHSHGGMTGAGGGGTTALASGSTSSALGVVDNRPVYVGLLKIMRVR